jgi:TRAP-type C4-dicarboxylate transport system permease small subunit
MSWLSIARRIEKTLDFAAALMLAVMVVCLGIQIVGRYLFHLTPVWSEEVARFMFVWMTMLASAAALRPGGHLAVTVLLGSASPKARKVLMVVRDVLILATVSLLAWTGWQFAALNAGQESPAMEVSMAIPYSALFAGAVLMGLMLALSRLAGTPIPAVEAIEGVDEVDPIA